MDARQRIAELEAELSGTKYNKATEFHFAIVKARIAKLREQAEKRSGGKTTGYAVKKSGDATAILIGYPSVGKSTLLNRLTNARSKVAAYEFTTLTVIPGTLQYKHTNIQVLDIPGIISGAAGGKGQGKKVLSIVRGADLALVLLDAQHPEQYNSILAELASAGIRLNQKPPQVKIAKKTRGGVSLTSTVPLTVSKETLVGMLKELGVLNADVVVREKVTVERFIDAVEGNKAYIPGIAVVNKSDLVDEQKVKEIKETVKPDLFISAAEAKGIDELKELIYQKIGFVHIYLKQIGKQPDLETPLVLRKGAKIKDICEKLHRDFVKRFSYAKVWQKDSKIQGQLFRDINKELKPGDVLEIHLR